MYSMGKKKKNKLNNTFRNLEKSQGSYAEWERRISKDDMLYASTDWHS